MCRKMGLQSLPVAFGVETAKWITVATIDVTQAAVAAYLFIGLKEPLYGGILTALILPQVRVASGNQACVLATPVFWFCDDAYPSLCRELAG